MKADSRGKLSLKELESRMRLEEKSEATIEKYMRDIKRFLQFAGDKPIDKELVIEYKKRVGENYAVASANSMIAAVNYYLKYKDKVQCCVKQFRVQRQVFCSENKFLTKSEYIRLVRTAEKKGDSRLALILQTICATGIRVGELEFITVEAVTSGQAVVTCKSKTRTIFIPAKLRRKLLKYSRSCGLTSGAVFITKTGKAINRCNIWRQMKALCRSAEVPEKKVFPHNLRHLFARMFYNLEKDISKLADILGHASLNTTRIYIMETGDEHKRKMERMKLIL